MTCPTIELPSHDLPAGDRLWSSLRLGKLGPAVYASRLKLSRRPIPDRWRRVFRGDYIRSLISHQRYLAQTVEILEAAAARSLPVMILRGTRLAETLYDDPAVRIYTDIDLLVPLERLEEAKRLARSLGFHPHAGSFHDSFFQENHYHLRYTSAGGDVPLELHWSLDPPFSTHRIDYGALFRDARESRLGGAPVLEPAPEDDLLLLAAHMMKHGTSLRGLSGSRLAAVCIQEGLLLWLMDLDLFLRRRPGLDWDALVDRARAWEIAGPVGTALSLLRDLLGSPVPGPALERLDERQGVTERVVGRLARGNGLVSRQFRSLHGGLLGSPAAFGLYRIPEVVHYLFPPARWAERHAPLPGRGLILRRAAHACRSAARLGRLAWGLARQTTVRVSGRPVREPLPVQEAGTAAAPDAGVHY